MGRRPAPIVFRGKPKESLGEGLAGLGQLLSTFGGIKQEQQMFEQAEQEFGLTPQESKSLGVDALKQIFLKKELVRLDQESKEEARIDKADRVTDILTTLGGRSLPKGVSTKESAAIPPLIRRPEEKATPDEMRIAAGQAVSEGLTPSALKGFKGLEGLFTPPVEKDRKTLEDVTGRKRFQDTGELVFPDITEEEIKVSKQRNIVFEATKRTEEMSSAKFDKPFRNLTQDQKSEVMVDRERSLTQSLTTTLRKEFAALPEVIQFKSLKPQFLKIEALGEKFKEDPNVNRAFMDQAMIVIFNKMIDPSSVVRESEFARTPEFIPMANRIAAALPKLIQGGAGMTDADRLQLIDDAKTLFDVHIDEFNRTIQERSELSEGLGVPSKFGVPAKKFEKAVCQSGQTASGPDGKKLICRGGTWQAL